MHHKCFKYRARQWWIREAKQEFQGLIKRLLKKKGVSSTFKLAHIEAVEGDPVDFFHVYVDDPEVSDFTCNVDRDGFTQIYQPNDYPEGVVLGV